MKLWTYTEAVNNIQMSCDLQDQQFIQPMEMVGYFNDMIKVSEAEILKIDEDYFLTKRPLPLVSGVMAYQYPKNIYAYKIRGMQYANGPIIYPINKFRRKDKFNVIANASIYNSQDDYRFFTENPSSFALSTMNLVPPSRETAVLAFPFTTSPFAPVWLWYIRHANRLPLIGEIIQEYEFFNSTSVNTSNNTLTLTHTYSLGDQVSFTTMGGTLFGGVTAGTTYFIILAGGGTYKLATSLANAQAGTAVTLTSQGVGVMATAIVGTQAILNSTVIDIPEYVEYILQGVRCRVYEKEGDPRLMNAKADLENLRMQMVATLTDKEQDDDNVIQPDMSFYSGMS